jgi:hypothetical protein
LSKQIIISSNFSLRVSANDLRADEGRETEALNCKPNTNLKEISELSNYCKPAAFVCTLLVLVAHDMVHKVDQFLFSTKRAFAFWSCFKKSE